MKEIVDEIMVRLHEQFPNAKTELTYSNSYTFLVAVMLSAQSTDRMVNKVTKSLFEIIRNPEEMLAFGEDSLKKRIQSIGLYNTKAHNIIVTTKKIVEEFHGCIPSTMEQLLTLPGIGRKSANVILSTIFKKTTIAVDTHVFRVAHRLRLCNALTPESTELSLMKTIPQKWLRKAHNLLVLHGRYVCKAKNPSCYACVLRDLCSYQAGPSKIVKRNVKTTR